MLEKLKALLPSKQDTKIPQASAAVYPFDTGYIGFRSLYFDGEKTPYELGPPINYTLDYYNLRARAWQSFLESDIVQNAIKKYCLWIVGTGLKLQVQPQQNLTGLSEEVTERFIEDVESRFRIFANESFSSYSGMESLNTLAAEALKNAINAGDVLCIIRFDGRKPTLQLIDGVHVQTPLDDKLIRAAKNRGNIIRQGVEVNKKDTHIAYYVRKDFKTWERVEARGRNTGRVKAWLFYGMKHKLSDVRGMSLLAVVLETIAKMNRYKDASLGTAEELAKIVYTIEHDKDSTGEDPTINQVVQSMGKGKGIALETDSYTSCEVGGVATKIAQTTSKQTYNMPNGATLKRPDIDIEPNFENFWKPNIELVYATLGIPVEVALDRYEGSFSSARAALKSWEYKMTVDRVLLLKNQYYKPFYYFWLDINVLNNTINAPGYLEALATKDFMTLAAYRKSRFIGVSVPHIDPLKEVSAERAKLGKQFDNTPLTTAEQAAENLNTGDFDQIIKKVENEKRKASDFDDPVDTNSNGSQISG